jgi:hypothetical protein
MSYLLFGFGPRDWRMSCASSRMSDDVFGLGLARLGLAWRMLAVVRGGAGCDLGKNEVGTGRKSDFWQIEAEIGVTEGVWEGLDAVPGCPKAVTGEPPPFAS